MAASAGAGRVTQGLSRKVRPILSLDRDECRKRSLNLYKAWYRQVPYMIVDYNLPITAKEIRDKLRSEFEKKRHVTDIRAIDMLVIKGQMELVETAKLFKQPCHIMNYFKDATIEPIPQDFLNKFLSGS